MPWRIGVRRLDNAAAAGESWRHGYEGYGRRDRWQRAFMFSMLSRLSPSSSMGFLSEFHAVRLREWRTNVSTSTSPA